MNLTEQAARLTELRDQIIELADKAGDLTDEETSRYAELNTEFDALSESHDGDWARAAEYAARDQALRSFKAGDYEHSDGVRAVSEGPAFHREVDPWDERTQRDIGERESVKRAVDAMPGLDDRGRHEIDVKLKRSGNREMRDAGVSFERHILDHSSEAYGRAFMKMASNRQYDLTAEERAALERSRIQVEQRAMSIGTTTAGGFMIPTILDPSVIWTTDGATNPFRQISNVKSIMTNKWTGVTSAGISMSWDTEGSEVSDDTPTLAQPSIDCHRLTGFVPISIEGYDDIVGVASEVIAEFGQARDEAEAAAFATGSGSGQPVGIVTALIGAAGAWTSGATNSSIVAADLTKIRRNTGPRYRGQKASWVMNVAYNDAIRALGTSGSLYSETVPLPDLAIDRLLGSPVYESSSMTEALNTTTNNAIVYGDFSNYVIADRIGTVVEFIPHLFATGNNRPSGQRGWYTYHRVGADSVNDAAFTLGVNQNTAFL